MANETRHAAWQTERHFAVRLLPEEGDPTELADGLGDFLEAVDFAVEWLAREDPERTGTASLAIFETSNGEAEKVWAYPPDASPEGAPLMKIFGFDPVNWKAASDEYSPREPALGTFFTRAPVGFTRPPVEATPPAPSAAPVAHSPRTGRSARTGTGRERQRRLPRSPRRPGAPVAPVAPRPRSLRGSPVAPVAPSPPSTPVAPRPVPVLHRSESSTPRAHEEPPASTRPHVRPRRALAAAWEDPVARSFLVLAGVLLWLAVAFSDSEPPRVRAAGTLRPLVAARQADRHGGARRRGLALARVNVRLE